MTLEEIQAAFDLTETNKLSMALLFDVKGPAETAGIDPKAWPHVYYSPLRPFSGIAYIFKQLGLTDDTAAALNVVHRGNKLGILFTKVLLPVDRVRDFDLQLDRMKAYLPMLREYAAEHPMVAFRDSRENAYLLFHNPRGIWQLSRFVPELGPVGHEEGQTPEPLLKEAMFYRPDDGLYIEDIMATAPALSGLDDVRITGVEYQPDIIQAELPSIVERLNAAGYDGDFEILGAGMTSVVLLDQASQRAFKVARHLPVDLNAISDEYDFLVSLRNTVAAPYLPEAFSFDIHAGVLVRDIALCRIALEITRSGNKSIADNVEFQFIEDFVYFRRITGDADEDDIDVILFLFSLQVVLDGLEALIEFCLIDLFREFHHGKKLFV